MTRSEYDRIRLNGGTARQLGKPATTNPYVNRLGADAEAARQAWTEGWEGEDASRQRARA